MNEYRANALVALLALLWVGNVQASNEPKEEPYVLAPFEVNDVPEGLPWKYLQTDGYEMITLLPRDTSERVIRSLRRGQMMLPQIFQPQRSSPVVVIIFDASVTRSPKAFPAVAMHYGSKRLGHNPKMWRGFSNSVRAYDRDSLIVAMRYENSAPVGLAGC